MSDPSLSAPPTAGPNPVLWVVFGVLSFTVVASAFLVYVALRGHEPEMPAHYHQEGAGLEADLARATEAQRLGARVTFDFSSGERLTARLSFADPARPTPAALVLQLTHATRPELDRTVQLTGAGEIGSYVARFAALPPGRWRVQVGDDASWRLRGGFESPVQVPVTLGP